MAVRHRAKGMGLCRQRAAKSARTLISLPPPKKNKNKNKNKKKSHAHKHVHLSRSHNPFFWPQMPPKPVERDRSGSLTGHFHSSAARASTRPSVAQIFENTGVWCEMDASWFPFSGLARFHCSCALSGVPRPWHGFLWWKNSCLVRRIIGHFSDSEHAVNDPGRNPAQRNGWRLGTW